MSIGYKIVCRISRPFPTSGLLPEVAFSLSDSYINQIENKKALPSLQGLFYICEYFGITPQQFFDDGNAYPVQLADLVEDMKKLDAASLEHIAAIVKEMVGNK